VKTTPLHEQKYELLRIMKTHDVEGMRAFIKNNRTFFKGVDDDKVATDRYIFDLIHVYKACTFHLGVLYFESVRYCLDKGLVTLSGPARELFEAAERNPEEASQCVVIPELGLDPHPNPSKS